jgi:EAL domain-containing protein (putative c-di-GMP-specific phosphodiesterase class I)
VAARIHAVLRPQDAAARMGGDVFAVASDRLVNPQAAEALARNLLRAIESDVQVGLRSAHLSARIGIALVDDDGTTADELLARAEAALRAAKDSAGAAPYRAFDESMLAEMMARAELDMALRGAVESHGFHLEYQPIVESDGRTIHAVEALLRWHPPGRSPIPPGRFIPLLEEAGLIVPVGSWVLREACRRAQSWVAHGAPWFTLSVNVSPLQIAEPDFVTQVLAIVEATGWPAQRLQFEVTEGVLLDPTPDLLQKLDALVDAGISLVLDDFGMGYSSLAYLKRFRLQALKIDRMFVIDVPAVAKDTAIVRAMVELAHALGLHVTAEGIETPQQWTALSRLGCDSLQGFLFAQPMLPAPMLERLLAQRPRADDDRALVRDWSTTLADQIEAELRDKESGGT